MHHIIDIIKEAYNFHNLTWIEILLMVTVLYDITELFHTIVNPDHGLM